MATTKLPERLALAHLPTPITKLERLSRRLGVGVWVWRDDQTGGVESGNKIRKLEFLAAEALSRGATHLITCGGPQSNHARATVYTARRLGLGVTVVVREPKEGRDLNAPPTGNLLLDRIAGADVRFIPYADYVAAGSHYDPFLEVELERCRAAGVKAYVVPEGGSSALGSWGYMHGVDEMLATWKSTGPGSKAPSAVVTAVGSGGTFAGLLLGFARAGLPTDRVHAVNVCDDAAYFQARVGRIVDEAVERFALPAPKSPFSLFDGYVGGGYAQATDEDLRTYAAIAEEEGLLLDPVYTGKAFRGMLAELARDKRRFGDEILFLHSGGIYGSFAFAAQYQRALAAR
jgi:D-cysteine desulfhydrase